MKIPINQDIFLIINTISGVWPIYCEILNFYGLIYIKDLFFMIVPQCASHCFPIFNIFID